MGRIILTGGISSGKSTVVSILEKNNIVVIDSDKIAKNIFTRNIPKIQEMFDTTLKGDKLRSFVGGIIFSNPRMKMKLEAFMHPKIRKVIQTKERGLKDKLHLIDMPLYFETHNELTNDFVILVSITYENQLHRLMERNKFTKTQANQRIMGQLPTAIKERNADYIIDNNGTMDELEENCLLMIKKCFSV